MKVYYTKDFYQKNQLVDGWPVYKKEEADAQIALKDLEIKLLKSHYRQGYFDLMKDQLDDPIAAGGKVKEIDAEIQQRLAKG